MKNFIRASRLRSKPWLPAALGLVLAVGACAPYQMERGPVAAPPDLSPHRFVAEDGTAMRVEVWKAESSPRAVIIAVHGMNEHTGAFDLPAERWRARGITTYAYDQRGFGNGFGRGRWPGTANLARDLREFTCLVARRHPALPLFVLGESMGGAVVIRAAGQGGLDGVAGLMLVAPAAVPFAELPVYMRAPLWLMSHVVPWATVTGEGLGLKPTDNFEAWQEMSRDERTILTTRIDATWGLTRLMDSAAAVASEIRQPALLLYGQQDDFVRERMTEWLRAQLPSERTRIEIFEDRHHWVLRDLEPGPVDRAIMDWMNDRIEGWHAARVRDALEAGGACGGASASHP